MLHVAYTEGVKAAFDRFGVKEANVPVGGVKSIGQKAWGVVSEIPGLMFGSPFKALGQGRAAFKPGGVLDLHNAFWPSVAKGPEGQRFPQVMGWLGRASTLASAHHIYKSMRGEAGDPNEGRLTNALSAAGGAVGMGLGFPGAGIVGAPYVARAGASLGKGLGHLLGSRPVSPSDDPLMYGGGGYQ